MTTPTEPAGEGRAHTPGPWAISEASLGRLSQPVITAPGRTICTLPSLRNAGGKVNERAATIAADARLIASAPDLVAALEGAAAHLGLFLELFDATTDERNPKELWNEARAALAEARRVNALAKAKL